MADHHDDAAAPGGDPDGIAADLLRAIDRGDNVQIARAFGAQSTWDALPLALEDDLLLVRSLHDFAVNGYAVMRVRDVVRVRIDDAERFLRDVLRADGALERAPAPELVPLGSWRAVFDAVRARHRFAIVECERDDGADFFLGELAEGDDDEAALHYIQVDGTRERGLTRVPFDEITLVRFDERYVNLFGRYAVAEDRH